MSKPIESWAIELWTAGDAKGVRLNRNDEDFISLSLVELIESDRGFVNVWDERTEEFRGSFNNADMCAYDLDGDAETLVNWLGHLDISTLRTFCKRVLAMTEEVVR